MTPNEYQVDAFRTAKAPDEGVLRRFQENSSQVLSLLDALVKISKFAEAVKRDIFYGEAEGELLDEEQARAFHLFHGVIGLASEFHELISEKETEDATVLTLDAMAVEEEGGDVDWYLNQMYTSCGLNSEDVKQKNIDKLKLRYPEKFTSEQSLNRDLVSEQQVFHTSPLNVNLQTKRH